MKQINTRYFRPLGCLSALLLLLMNPQHAYGQSSDAIVEAKQDDIVIIAHPSVQVSTLSRHVLLELYTLEQATWEDGSLVTLFDLKPETEAKRVFYQYLRQKPRELKKIWMRVVLSGEGRTPRILGHEEEVVKKVAETPGALGYSQRSLVTDDVKVLGVVGSEAIIESSGRK